VHIDSSANIIVLCNNEVAFPALANLVYSGALKGVVIPQKNKELVGYFKSAFAGSGIPLTTVNKKNLVVTLETLIREKKVDSVWLMTFPYIIPARVLSVPPRGFINFHYGLLPQYRGVNPVLAQMLNYETHGGITVHVADKGVDTGPIVFQQQIEITDDDTFGTHLKKLAILGAEIALNLLKLFIFSNALPAVPQDESKAAYFGKVSAKDLMIDWSKMTSFKVIRLINACNPWNKGAGAVINNQVVCFTEAELVEEPPQHIHIPGTILTLDHSSGLTIQCSDEKIIKVVKSFYNMA
jgi:methionyl-tRNA formyltransferase